jgi:AraC-like DNA-binding protein
VSFLVRSLAATYFDGHHLEPHAHAWGQLIYAASGVMRVRAGDRLWLVPPARAVWAPAGLEHEIWARGEFAMRTLYLEPGFALGLPAECRALEVSPFLRELVLKIVQAGMLSAAEPRHRTLAEALLHELSDAEVLPLSLPLPTDARALRAAERMQADAAADLPLEELARGAGASVRTLQRLFRDETGLRIAEWRQRLRLLHAAGLLASGAPVTEAGLEAGYSSTSAFIAAFRRQFGRTPARMR